MESDSFIFDDDIEEIGSDVEAFCPKCKADTAHTIITKYEEEIRRVQCSPCGDVHAYRKPRGEVEEETAQADERNRKKVLKKATWDEFFAKHDNAAARPYTFRDTYIENDIVTHPKFGVGFASETYDEDKVEITFKDQRRVLVHNRKELPGAPPELARAPKPRPVVKPLPKGKKAKAAAAAAAAQAAAALGAPALTRAELAAQKKAAKEAARLQKEQERATAKAQKEQERAAAKAKVEQERTAKRAKLEKERAAKQAKLEKERAKKAAKLEKERAARKAKLEHIANAKAAARAKAAAKKAAKGKQVKRSHSKAKPRAKAAKKAKKKK
jgi:hypothetical protein